MNIPPYRRNKAIREPGSHMADVACAEHTHNETRTEFALDQLPYEKDTMMTMRTEFASTHSTGVV